LSAPFIEHPQLCEISREGERHRQQ
jgi:hypothetical protein